MEKENNSVSFCLSKDLKIPFQIKILSFEGYKATNEEYRHNHEIFLTIQLVADNKLLLPSITKIVKYSHSVHHYLFKEKRNDSRSLWIKFPIHYSQLPLTCKLRFILFDYHGQTGERIVVGFTELNIFNIENDDEFEYSCALKRGSQKIPVKLSSENGEVTEASHTKHGLDDVNLQRKIKNFEINGKQNQSLSWLNELSNKKISQLNKLYSQKNCYLHVEFKTFDIPVVYSDVKYSLINIPTITDKIGSAINENDLLSNNIESALQTPDRNVFDPEQYRDSRNDDPIELKFRKLERTHQSSFTNKDIKPTLKMRENIINVLRKQFFEKLTLQEKNLIWKYRFFVLNNLILNKNYTSSQFNNFTVNFMKAINWDDDFEVKEFLTLIDKVPESTNSDEQELTSQMDHRFVFITQLEIVDCLELLRGNYQNPIVRNMAIDRLRLAPDKDLEFYLVQLVQCLRYETGNYDYEEMLDSSFSDDIVSSKYTFVDDDPIFRLLTDFRYLKQKHKKLPDLNSPLARFLIQRSIENERLTNFFYWCLKVETDGELLQDVKQPVNPSGSYEEFIEEDTRSPDAGSPSTITINKKSSNIFKITLTHFIVEMSTHENGKMKVKSLKEQVLVMKAIQNISLRIRNEFKKETTPAKIEILKSLLSEKRQGKWSLSSFPPIHLPLNPAIEVSGTIPEQSSVFRSSLSPLKITFKTIDNSSYPVMYKIGDDLRQDQFVIQLITLMERILQNENLDMKLTPYKILSMGAMEGLMEFIPNEALSSILKNNGSVLSFLKQNNPDPNSSLGVRAEVMDNYVRSCAGYCVITYLLGVGDRHLDNLLLSKDGHFFHVDFGYILGEDPKPFPPLMKLPIQVIEGMGGLNDENYKLFCNYCFITYITLRKNSSLILNLVQLMIDSSIPLLRTKNSDEQEKTEIILKIQEKFMLELNDEDAVLHFQNLINDSVNAFLPVVIDRLHNLAQYWMA